MEASITQYPYYYLNIKIYFIIIAMIEKNKICISYKKETHKYHKLIPEENINKVLSIFCSIAFDNSSFK